MLAEARRRMLARARMLMALQFGAGARLDAHQVEAVAQGMPPLVLRREEERPRAPCQYGAHAKVVLFDVPGGLTHVCLLCSRQALVGRGKGWWLVTPCVPPKHSGGRRPRLVSADEAADWRRRVRARTGAAEQGGAG